MIGIHLGVARAHRRAAARKAILVVGGFLLLAGAGISAGMVQAKRSTPPHTPAVLDVQTNASDTIPPPSYNSPSASSENGTGTTPAPTSESATTKKSSDTSGVIKVPNQNVIAGPPSESQTDQSYNNGGSGDQTDTGSGGTGTGTGGTTNEPGTGEQPTETPPAPTTPDPPAPTSP
jgi:hypothetical protein